VRGLIADHNIAGIVDRVVATMQNEPYRLFWESLGIGYIHFEDIGLVPTTPDSEVWKGCRELNLLLITDNRNHEGTDSLNATIQSRSCPDSIPVATIGSVDRLRTSRAYLELFIDGLYDTVTNINSLLGTGRIFLP